ncbi:MAG: M3 family metallopeptidase [Opitutae bacterium]|nr:M3 family metallopeptidase [Opitutae bacterium]
MQVAPELIFPAAASGIFKAISAFFNAFPKIFIRAGTRFFYKFTQVRRLSRRKNFATKNPEKMKKPLIAIAAIAILPFLSACCADNECAKVAPEAAATENAAQTPQAEHPFLDTSLDIKWSQLTPDKIVPDMTIELARARANIDAIASLPTDDPSVLTYENTLGALWRNFAEFDFVWGKVSHLENVAMSDDFRKAYAEILPKVSEYEAQTALDARLWNVLKAYSQTDEAKNLSPQKARYLKETLDGFRDGGADLPDDKKAELTAISKELTTITQQFSQNVLDATNAYKKLVENEANLAGLPELEKAAAFEAAKQAGLATDEKPAWLFTLKLTSYAPVLKYAENEDLRREIWEAANETCVGGEFDNLPIMRRILELRQREAEILGEKNFSDLTLKRRMAKNGDTALAFVQKLHDQTLPAFEREYAELKSFRRSNDPTYDGGDFKPWDLSFWTEKMRQANYDFDADSVKPYFPMPAVMNGLFALTERLYNVEIREEKSIYIEPGSGVVAPAGTAEVWHPDVKFYSIYDKNSKRKLGIFYTDWFPRDSKRGGAWMNPAFAGERSLGEINYGLVCGNVTAPVGDDPALLSHYDVETIFHEFGHLMHHLLGNTEIAALNGTSVAWDFVEFPSQLNENWTWEPEVLATFAKHYKTGEPLPKDMLEKMIRARNFQAAYQQMRQLGFAYVDLYLHLNATEIVKSEKDVNAIGMELSEPFLWKTDPVPNTNLPRFTHLFRDPVGYASAYYSYKWAEALEADAFTSVFRNPDGTLNYDKGMEYRKKILEKGDSEDAAVLFKDFVGRDPDWNAINVLYEIQ